MTPEIATLAVPGPNIARRVQEVSECAHCHNKIHRNLFKGGAKGEWYHDESRDRRCTLPAL